MAWFPAVQEMAIARGIVKESIDIAQGGYRGGATSASAGTHDGGGAFDFVQYSDDLVTLVRQMGGAGWHRTTAQGFSGPHLHIELVGCPHHPSADYQVEAYTDGYNGLGNGWKGRDDGPRVNPIRTWSQGIAWAKTQLNELELTVSQYTDLRAILVENQKRITDIKAIVTENQKRVTDAKATGEWTQKIVVENQRRINQANAALAALAPKTEEAK